MSSVNQISSDYIFFRFPLNYLLVLIPIFVGVSGNIFFSFTHEITEPATYSPEDEVFGSIDVFLISMMVSIAVLLAFSVCYRWSSMQYDGSYGYWLTQGLGRKQFYILTVLKFFATFFFSEVLALILIIFINGYTFPFNTLLLILFLMASQLFLVLTLAVLTGVIFKTSELASLSFLALVFFNIAFNSNTGSYYNLILRPDLHYLSKNAWLSFTMSLALGIITFLTGLRVHTKLDLRL